jgi:hypothetical protein
MWGVRLRKMSSRAVSCLLPLKRLPMRGMSEMNGSPLRLVAAFVRISPARKLVSSGC